ncbi:unnamed protein product [Laminaria digitata]
MCLSGPGSSQGYDKLSQEYNLSICSLLMIGSLYCCLQDDIGEEESGWKLVHGDVFRFPR